MFDVYPLEVFGRVIRNCRFVLLTTNGTKTSVKVVALLGVASVVATPLTDLFMFYSFMSKCLFLTRFNKVLINEVLWALIMCSCLIIKA